MKPSTTVQRLPVRVRRTMIHRGESERALLVHCPLQRGSCSLERCRECERCEGLSMEGDGIKDVLCAVEDSSSPARKIMPTAAEVTSIGAIMDREVICVSPSLGRAEAIAICLSRGISGAAVVDSDGRPLGMLTRSDLLQSTIDHPQSTLVADIMTPIAYALGENDALSRGAALMAAEGVHHLPVTGDHGRVVGMISTFDVTRWLARQSGYEV
jgi:CBS domain-containing protein